MRDLQPKEFVGFRELKNGSAFRALASGSLERRYAVLVKAPHIAGSRIRPASVRIFSAPQYNSTKSIELQCGVSPVNRSEPVELR